MNERPTPPQPTPPPQPPTPGRIILRVEEVDSLYSKLKERGLEPESPRDGDPGERFFYLKDPDGHGLTFAQLLS